MGDWKFIFFLSIVGGGVIGVIFRDFGIGVFMTGVCFVLGMLITSAPPAKSKKGTANDESVDEN